jgi:hypothetical protein
MPYMLRAKAILTLYKLIVVTWLVKNRFMALLVINFN